MANMSYCRFENTFKDLLDCYRNMENVSSNNERNYREQLIQLCEYIINDYGDGFVFSDEEEEDEE